MAEIDRLREYLASLCPELLNFDSAATLGGWINDYEEPVITDNYVLAKILKRTRQKVREDYGEKTDPFLLRRSQFVIAFNRDAKKMPFDRFSLYLQNRFSFLDSYTRSIAVSYLDLETGECRRPDAPDGRLDYAMKHVDLMFSLADPAKPRTDDFDIDLILRQLEAKNDGKHLFKGTTACGFGYGSIPSLNCCNHLHDNETQQREQALADRLLNHRNYRGTRTDAVIDLMLAGRGTNFAVLTADPMTALYNACAAPGDLPGCISVLAKTGLEIRRELEYPVKSDFILHADAAGNAEKLLQAQAGVLVYCHKGHIHNENPTDYAVQNIWIPNEAAPLLLEYSGLKEHDVYPDPMNMLMEPWNGAV